MQVQPTFKPTPQGTIFLLLATAVGYVLSFQEQPPSGLARLVSIALLLGILGSVLLDGFKGLRNLLRIDLFAILSFYFLTFFEFLFRQTRFDLVANPDDVVYSIHLFLAGFSAMVIGRHLNVFPQTLLKHIGQIEIRPKEFLLIFFGAAFLSFLPSFLAVGFNPVEWFQETLKPRFGREWGRGRYGDLSALLYELRLLGYVLPPIAGVLFARRKEHSLFTISIVGLVIMLLWYLAFSSGTRNVLAIQVAGLFAGYFVVQPKLRLRVVIPTVVIVGASFLVLADFMLGFREIGLERYIGEGYYKSYNQDFVEEYQPVEEAQSDYFVDYNLWRLSQIVGAFPSLYDFIGWNMPYVALTKPIPRAFWPGKPLDLKTGLEEAIGAEGYTIAVTWIGEAYVAGGMLWILPIGLLIGMFCSYWNGLAGYVNHAFPLIVFASGFYAVLLLMRTLMFFTTALLPSILLIVMGVIIHKHRTNY